SPVKTELPHVFSAIRLIDQDADAPIDAALGEFGTVITPPMQVSPEELRLNDPFDLPSLWANVVDDGMSEFRAAFGSGELPLTNGTTLRPYASVVLDIAGHEDVLAGDDQLQGGAGDDLMVGDNATIYTPLISGLLPLDNAMTDAR